MDTAYSYIRFSTATQRLGRSAERQLAECQKWCAKHNLALSDDSFRDEGVSGFTGDNLDENGQLRRFMQLVDNGKILRGSYLIVESLDRLSRQNVWSALQLFMDVIRKGIKIVTLVNERTYSDTSSEHDLLLSIFELSRAHDESRHKSVRAKDVWKAKLKNARQVGTPVGKQIPKWLELRDGAFAINAERAEIVKHIFDYCIEGRGAVWVAKFLNQQGTRAFRHNGTWSTSSVLEILKNRRVLGEWEPADGLGTIDHYYPQIIEQDIWNRAQVAMDLRRRTKTTKQTSTFQVWQGIAKCAFCRSPMHLNVKNKYRYLACSNRRKGLCSAKPIRSDETDLVFAELMAQVGSISLVHTNSASLLAEVDKVKGELLTQQSILQRHTDAAQSLTTSTSIYKLIQVSESTIEALNSRVIALENELMLETINEEDKSWFVQRLELDTFAGRSKANGYLRRQSVEVSVRSGTYLVSRAGTLILVLNYSKDRILITPLDEAQARRLISYGTIPLAPEMSVPNVESEREKVIQSSIRMAEQLREILSQTDPE